MNFLKDPGTIWLAIACLITTRCFAGEINWDSKIPAEIVEQLEVESQEGYATMALVSYLRALQEIQSIDEFSDLKTKPNQVIKRFIEQHPKLAKDFQTTDLVFAEERYGPFVQGVQFPRLDIFVLFSFSSTIGHGREANYFTWRIEMQDVSSDENHLDVHAIIQDTLPHRNSVNTVTIFFQNREYVGTYSHQTEQHNK